MAEPVDALRAVGFWSYVRADDEAEGGRIRRLAGLIQTEYAMLTGDDIEIFVDRDDLVWGDEWKRRIDIALEGTTFFIPVITPRYFRSPECRRELLTFDMHARSRGVPELLLPLLYVEVPRLEPESGDEAVALVARIQYERWTKLRLEAEDSAEYRQGVNKLARRLVEIGASLESHPRVAAEETVPSTTDGSSTEEPGFIDIMADSEEALPRWNATIERFAEIMEEIATASEEAARHIERSDAQGKGFAGRLTAARTLATRLNPLAAEVLELGTQYASDLVTVDSGVLTLIRRAAEEGVEDPEEREAACELFNSLRKAAAAGRENVASLTELTETIRQTAQMSRDLRPPLGDIENGLRRVMDGQAVMDEWVRLMDEVDIDCPPPRPD
jgi:hypothetical protein